MLFSPKRKSYLNVYMLWSDSVHLTDTKYFIHDPSNYDAHGEFIQPKQHMALICYVFFLRFVTSLVCPPPPPLIYFNSENIFPEKKSNNFQGPTYTFMCSYTNSSDYYV